MIDWQAVRGQKLAGESVWDHPCDEHYRKVYEKYKDGQQVKKNHSKDPSAQCEGTSGSCGVAPAWDDRSTTSLLSRKPRQSTVPDCSPVFEPNIISSNYKKSWLHTLDAPEKPFFGFASCCL